MSEMVRQPTTTPGPDEKQASVIFYTASNIVWGEVLYRSTIRVSTWLRTNAVPDFLTILNAKVLNTTSPIDTPKPIHFPEIHIPTSQVLAYHLLPPAKDPMDYDPTEPNRCMDPVTVIVGTFKFDGFMRMSTRMVVRKYLEVTREGFSSIYDVDISNLIIPSLGVVKAPFVQVRQLNVMFAIRPA
jgi:hypothetical protein